MSIVVQPAHVLPDIVLASSSLQLVLLTVSETGQQQYYCQSGQYTIVDVWDSTAPTSVGVLSVYQPG
jgi:hypothetical protein